MKLKILSLPIALLLAAAATALGAADGAGADAAAIESPVPPYGAADFEPMPEAPVGFRADVNGWYPGAAPPAEWWDGTPARVVRRVANNNEGRIPPDAKPVPVWAAADLKAKNVLWKTPLPGWGDGQPVVAGGRVMTILDPNLVLCFDADTGEVVWQDKLAVMTLPALGEDRREPGPAPDPQKAKAEQVAWELARAMYFLRAQGGGGGTGGGDDISLFGDEQWVGRRPVIEQSMARVKEWRMLLQDGHLPPELPAAMDAVAAGYRTVLDAPDANARKKSWRELNRNNPYTRAFEKAYRVPIHITWSGLVGGAFSTPVTDGKVVVVCFAYGQVAAYDVASGERLWAWRDGLIPHTQYVNHGASPWMYRDLVLVRSGDGQAIMGLDKATGQVRWETAVQKQPRGRGANHGNYITPVLMDVPADGEGKRTVLVTQEPPVLDPVTGEVLGLLEIRKPAPPRSDRGTMVGRDGRLFTGWGYDGPSSPTFGFRLALTGSGLSVSMARNLEGNQERGIYGAAPIVYRPGVLVGDHARLFDPETGLELFGTHPGHTPVPPQGRVSTLCGDLMVSSSGVNDFQRTREDDQATEAFWVSDVRDPRRPRVLSGRNVLDGFPLPADPIWDTYMKGFDKRRNVGCYLGLPPWFGTRVGGVVPKGERLYVQSAMALYCIGPAVKGAPGDDPAVVEAIRKSDAGRLAQHLASDSAQYRYEAVKRLAEVGPPAPARDRLLALLREDPYEEVRAAAMQALDKSDPQGRPGWSAFAADLAEAERGFDYWKDETVHRLRSHVLTVRALGEAGAKELLARGIPDAAGGQPSQPPLLLRGLLYVAGELGLEGLAATDAALAVVSTAEPRPDRRLAVLSADYLAHTAFRDPRVLPALLDSPHFGGEDQLPYLEGVLTRTPDEDLPAVLDKILRERPVRNHMWDLVARAGRRIGPERAVPLLEKVAADKPELAPRMAEVIEAVRTSDLDPRPEAQARGRNN